MTNPPSLDPFQEKTAEFIEVGAEKQGVTVQFGARTHPGKTRQNNEDQFLLAQLAKSMKVCKSSLPDSGSRLFSEEVGYLWVVADGMGGAAAGERASALAIATVEDFALNTLKWFLHLRGSEEHVLLAELREGIERADREVIERARTDPRMHGMGTTLTMAYSVGTDLFIVHAGDTRAYLFHDGEIDKLTNDHTLVQILVDQGAISAEDAKRHKRRNVVTNVIGGPSEGVHAEIHKLRVRDGDILLLCSDGLTEVVDDQAIARVLGEQADMDTACEQLIQHALDAGGPDNITVLLARYKVA
ncbi:MAG: protein phosphatase 2C domain-containing protein [Isosphaeraceae bacterium]